MDITLEDKLIENVQELTNDRITIESLIKILLNYFNDEELTKRDITSLIIVLLERVEKMKINTENLNLLLKI